MSASMYREYILDHYKHPRNRGTLEAPDITHHDANPLCGDEVQIDVELDDDRRVKSIAFSGHGCAISQASTSIMSELSQGKTLDEIKSWNKDNVTEWMGIPLSPIRLKCALLGLKVLQAGIYEYERDHETEPLADAPGHAAS